MGHFQAKFTITNRLVQYNKKDSENGKILFFSCHQIHHASLAAVKLATLTTFAVVFISGCANIWNASDLAIWVKDRAVEQGCQRETIELEEWHTETVEGNVWQVTCRETQGNTKSFGINVDPVWTPSAVQPKRAGPAIKSEKTGKLPQ